MVVTWKPIHALKMKHGYKALVYGLCLAVFNDPGITEGAGKVPTLALMNLALLILARTEAGIGVSKLVLGQKRRNYSNKATATSIVTVMVVRWALACAASALA
jgi:hypothetical protein